MVGVSKNAGIDADAMTASSNGILGSLRSVTVTGGARNP
jgi:hypothetical protein